QDSEIEIPVAQVVAAGIGAVDLADLLHPEYVDVELGGLVHVLGREGDVLDLGHEASPSTMGFLPTGGVHRLAAKAPRARGLPSARRGSYHGGARRERAARHGDRSRPQGWCEDFEMKAKPGRGENTRPGRCGRGGAPEGEPARG